MSPEQEIVSLGVAAWARADQDSAAVLPYAEAVLELARSPRMQRAEVGPAFEALLAAGGDPELVEVCVHVLRWPELRQHMHSLYEQAATSNNVRLVQVLRHILEAFQPDWASQNTEFFGGFFAKQSVQP